MVALHVRPIGSNDQWPTTRPLSDALQTAAQTRTHSGLSTAGFHLGKISPRVKNNCKMV